MTITGIIDGLPIIDYVRDPAPHPSLSASIAHLLLTRSPRHAWMRHARLNSAWEPSATAASDIGTIAHAILLEGDESRVEVIAADDYRKKETQALRDQARAAGRLPILAERLADVRQMVDVAREALAAGELKGVLETASIERTLIWEEDGAWLRCRPDAISADSRILIDYKTTGSSAEPDAWGRGMLLSMGYDIQAAIGLRGANALLGPDDRKFVFIVQETEPPYAVSFPALDPQFVIFADEKLNAAIRLWKACLAENRWPGYTSRIAWVAPPEWAVARFADRMGMIEPQAFEDEGVEAL